MNKINTNNILREKTNKSDLVWENINEIRNLCWQSAYAVDNKYDPKYFFQISDNIRDIEQIIKEWGVEIARKHFANVYCSYEWRNINWETDWGKLVRKLDDAGSVCLRALNTDIRVRIIPEPVLLRYQNIFYYIWQLKECLNIQPSAKDCKKKGDYRYPNFGYCYSVGEYLGKSLRNKL